MDQALPGDRFLAGLQLKRRFRDRHEQRAYDRAKEIARRIVNDPSLIGNAVVFLEKHVGDDPHQARYYAAWKVLLTRPASVIAAAMLEDSDVGAELRGSAPVFVVLNPDGPITP